MREEEIAAVAKGLTKAQREAIVGARRSFGSVHLIGSPAALHALKRKGITNGPFADHFTDPLGLALWQHLLDTPEDV